MLRYYEAEGLVTPGRTSSGYRDYGQQDEDAVARIVLLGRTGMTLQEIRAFLPCALDGRGEFESCDEPKVTLRSRIARVDKQVRDLSDGRRLLSELLDAFETSSSASDINRSDDQEG